MLYKPQRSQINRFTFVTKKNYQKKTQNHPLIFLAFLGRTKRQEKRELFEKMYC